MEVLIITGMSGAGKTQTVNLLEDIGYFCVDNIPPELLCKFVELCVAAGRMRKVAIVTDARVGNDMSRLGPSLIELMEKKIRYKILFLDSSDAVLMNRFKEQRRRHPFLALSGGLMENSIKNERAALAPIKENADIVIDTSNLSLAELKDRLRQLFLSDQMDGLFINVLSFGFKFGAPTEADIIYDVRCLPNPYYIEDLKHLTGLDKKVRDYVLGFKEAQTLLDKLIDILGFSAPLYLAEGRTHLVIAIGCTGGKHRSVTFAEKISAQLKREHYSVVTTHRDILK